MRFPLFFPAHRSFTAFLKRSVVIAVSSCVCVCVQLPRAVSTQALSGAGFLKMINRATDAVSKMTIKMNESDVVSKQTVLLLATAFI